MHTFDPRMIVMRTRTSNRRVSENGANGGNDNHCSIFLQSSASSSLRDFVNEIAGSKVPGGQQQTLARISRFLTTRRQQVADPRCDLSLRLQASRVSRSRFPIPGSGSQALATPVATPIKTVAAEGVRNVMNPATSPEIQPGAILDY